MDVKNHNTVILSHVNIYNLYTSSQSESLVTQAIEVSHNCKTSIGIFNLLST